MFKKIIRMGLPLAVALGLVIPTLTQEKGDPGKTERNKTKKRTEKPTGKEGNQRRKAEQPKAQ